jgi:hypothetical protein
LLFTKETNSMTTLKACLYARHSPRPNAMECDSCIKQIERERAFCHAMG